MATATDTSTSTWQDLTPETQAVVRSLMRSLSIFEAPPPVGKGFVSAEQLEGVLPLVCVRVLPFKHAIQRQGELVEHVCVVLDGSLAKFHEAEVVEYLQKGSQIGLLHMVCGDAASSTVLVDSDEATCVYLSKASLDACFAADATLLRCVSNNLCRALRRHARRSRSARLVRMVEHLNATTPEMLDHSGDKADSAAPSAAVKTVTAALAGLGSMTLAFPLEVVRTKLQTSGRGDVVTGLRLLGTMASEEGLGSLFQGWGSSAVSHTVQNTVFHRAYDHFLTTFKSPGEALSDPAKLGLGVLAGCVSATVVNPLSTVTFRLQGKGAEGHSTLSMLLHIIREDGFFSLWNGIGPSLALSLNPCLTFYTFDDLKGRYLRRKQALQGAGDQLQATLSPLETLAIGALAKSIASFLTFPLLMAKIRMGLFGREKYPSLYSTFAIVCRSVGACPVPSRPVQRNTFSHTFPPCLPTGATRRRPLRHVQGSGSVSDAVGVGCRT